jgi:long-chain acyl-CoA synthetase
MPGGILEALHEAPAGRLALRDDRRWLDYSELRSAVETESRWLARQRIGRCAVLADNGAAWVIADLALMQSAALNVPLPGWFTSAQIDHVVADAGIEGILTDDPDRVAREHGTFRHVDAAPASGLALFRRELGYPSTDVSRGVIKITYTSGSTGAPKGVCLSADTIEQVASSLALATSLSVERHLCVMPLATLLENIAGVYVPLLLGASCMTPSMRTTGMSYGAFDARSFVSAISSAAPQSLILVPELLRVLIAAAKRGWVPPQDLKFIAVGGAAVSASLLDEAAALGLPTFEGYGLSECASVVCLNTPAASRRGSVGKPLSHAQVRLDSSSQLVVRGAVMSGYLGQQAHAYGEIPTGDLGSIDADGYVYVRGRLKNMFITSMGRNISPEWVESELLREVAVGQAVVFGEARPWPVALISPTAPSLAPTQIARSIDATNARLPDYAQVRRWACLPQPLRHRDGLLTANGRPRRDAIALRYSALIDGLYETAFAS